MGHYLIQGFLLFGFGLGLFVLAWALWELALKARDHLEESRRNARRIPHRPRSSFASQTDRQAKQ